MQWLLILLGILETKVAYVSGYLFLRLTDCAFNVLYEVVQSFPQNSTSSYFCILTTEPSVTEGTQEILNGQNEATEVINSNGQQQADSPVLVPTSPTEVETAEETKNNKGELLHDHFMKDRGISCLSFDVSFSLNQI